MESQQLVRKLAAVFYADVAGYSRLTGEDEEGTHRRLSIYLDVITGCIGEYGGTIGHYAGDAVLADFPTVVAALNCAVRIQNELRDRNQSLPEGRRVRFRIGINLGDVIVDRGEVHGDGVNVTARLESIADPGGICISGATYDAIGTKLPLSYEFMGQQSLKNIDRPIRAYRVLLEYDGREESASEIAPSPKEIAIPSIVVLPFENLSAESDQDYFCDGLTQDITTDISKFSDLLVIDAHSAFSYKNRAATAREVGRELRVAYLLEGSVQKTVNRVRINAQLIDTASGHHLWAERFDREYHDIFSVQDEIIEVIVVELALEVDAAERSRAMHQGLTNINSYDAFLRGKHQWWSYLYSLEQENTLEESRKYFELAIELEPEFARPWAWLTYVHLHMWLDGWSEKSALESAERCAKKSLALNPFDYVGHWALAYFYLYTGNIELALSEYETALQSNKNEANMLAEMSEALCYSGRHEEGIGWIRRAMRINPRFPGWYRSNLAMLYYFLKDYDKAISELGRIATLRSDDHALLAAAHGRRSELLEGSDEHDLATEERRTAGTALQQYTDNKSGWTLEGERRLVSFMKSTDVEHWIAGIQLAGGQSDYDERLSQE